MCKFIKLNFFFLETAILGIHGMLSQSQSRYVENVDAGKSLRGSGLKKYKPGKKTRKFHTYVRPVSSPLQASNFFPYKSSIIEI